MAQRPLPFTLKSSRTCYVTPVQGRRVQWSSWSLRATLVSAMANRHFGKLADVWKHLVLAEVLSVDRPRQLCDTHAGHACYMMTSDAERRYGVLGFMEAAIDDDVLSRSAYFRLLVRQRNNGTELSDYPAGPLLAMLELGSGSKYLFCDLNPESC